MKNAEQMIADAVNKCAKIAHEWGYLAVDKDFEPVIKQSIEDLRAKNERLRDALRFYENPANWRSPSTGFEAMYDPRPSPISSDCGKTARVALAGGE